MTAFSYLLDACKEVSFLMDVSFQSGASRSFRHSSVALKEVVLVETVHPSSLQIVRMSSRLPTSDDQKDDL